MTKNYFDEFSGMNSMIGNLKIKDSEYLKEAKEYLEIYNNIDNTYKLFLKDLEMITDLLEGKFAENMKAFGKNIQFYLNDELNNVFCDLNKTMKSYISEIDDADGKMY